jgi:transposase-like protein
VRGRNGAVDWLAVSSAAKESDGENILTAGAPAARSPISDSAKGTAGRKNILITASAPDGTPPAPKQRCSFTDAEASIVLETEQPGAIVSQAARAHGIVTGVLVRWRTELGSGRSKAVNLVAVRIGGNINSDASAEVMAAALTWVRTHYQPAAERVSDARSECQTFAPRLQVDLLLHRRSANGQTTAT